MSERGYMSRKFHLVRAVLSWVKDSQVTGVTEEEVSRGGDKKHLSRQILPAAPRARAVPMEVYGGADMNLQPMEDPMLEQVNVLEGSCDPVERSPCWSTFSGGTCSPVGGTP